MEGVSEKMNNLIYFLSTIVIIGSTLALFYYSIKFLSAASSKGKYMKKYREFDEIMGKLDNTIMLSIMAVNKSMVEKLKQSSSFLQQEKEEA